MLRRQLAENAAQDRRADDDGRRAARHDEDSRVRAYARSLRGSPRVAAREDDA